MSDNPISSKTACLEFVAQVRYVGWCCYQLGVQSAMKTLEDPKHAEQYKAMGGITQFKWEPNKDQLESLLNAVRYLNDNPNMTAKDNHNNWMKSKFDQGWMYGPKKDFESKMHPDLVPYEDLLEVERAKDEMDLEMHKQGMAMWNIFIEIVNQIGEEGDEEESDSGKEADSE